MSPTAGLSTRSVTLRPVRHANWVSTVVALLAAFLPADVTAFVIATGGGDLGAVTLLACVTLLVGLALAWRSSRARLQLERDRIVEHGLLTTPRTVAGADVASAVVLTVYDRHTLEPRRRLFLLDERDRPVLRMRSGDWSDEQIAVVARHFDVPVHTTREPVMVQELRRERGRLLVWWERYPLRAVLVWVTTGLAISATVAVTLNRAL